MSQVFLEMSKKNLKTKLEDQAVVNATTIIEMTITIKVTLGLRESQGGLFF